jgi:hypothetical protein
MHRQQTQSKSILHRVLYFVCQLESCGDEEFMTAMRPKATQTFPPHHDEGNGQVVLFSTN